MNSSSTAWDSLKNGYEIEDLERVSQLVENEDTPAFKLTDSLVGSAPYEPSQCQNFKAFHRVSDFNRQRFHSGGLSALPPLYDLYRICRSTLLVNCQNPSCSALKLEMMPLFKETNSEWPAFREWVMVRTSCLMVSRKRNVQWSDSTLSYLESVIANGKGPAKFTRLSVEIYELLEWMATIDDHWDSAPHRAGPLNEPRSMDEKARIRFESIKSLPYSDYQSRTDEALKEARDLGMCRNRLWNVINGSPRGEFDIVCLMEAVRQTSSPSSFAYKESNPQFVAAAAINPIAYYAKHSHSACSPDLCHFASIDSTSVKPLCRCNGKKCDKKEFPLKEGHLLYFWSATAGENSHFSNPSNAYVAISHVWSDGTGADKGFVHPCMFEYFQGIARDNFCDAFWWDALSIPREPKARALAIRDMHQNFSRAKVTVVHDLYTANFPWDDDGSPCIALALSPWFTRGWTALELIVSKKVKVLFKDPIKPGCYVLKDLDTEVLATDPAKHTRGHWIASNIIRRLRSSQVKSLSEVLQILGTRSTSWPRDRLVIASLLCGLKPDVLNPNMQAILTKDIIAKFQRVDPSFLMHGCPIENDGLFSWCPSTLLIGLKSHISSGFAPGTDELKTFPDGTVQGRYKVKIMAQDYVNHLQPFATHRSVLWRIKCAFENWQHCMLIWPKAKNENINNPAILVTVLDYHKNDLGGLLDCRMEGVVYGIRSQVGPPYTSVRVRLGQKVDQLSSKTAQQLFDIYNQAMFENSRQGGTGAWED